MNRNLARSTARRITGSIGVLLAVFVLSLHQGWAAPVDNGGAQGSNDNQAGSQTVRGRVVDAESNAPVSGVRITVIGDSVKRGAISDKNGVYKIRNVPVGRKTLKVSAIAYQEQTIPDVMVAAGKEMILDIRVTEKVTKTNDVVVSADRSAINSVTNNEFATGSVRTFNIEDTKKYAGALGDPSRMVQNFAGVIGANDSRNDIVVRGNSPTGMLWQIEGMNIPNPNHFGAIGSTGGPVSMINNNTLEKSDFFTGAFPAQYGNASAGVFDLRLRNGNTEKHEYLIQMGFNGVEAGAEGPLPLGAGSSYLFNYRYSTLSLFKDLGLDFGTGGAVPDYQDATLRINLQVDDATRIVLFGLGGKSDVSFLGNDQDTTDGNLYANENENTIVDYGTGIVGASLEHNFNEQTFLKMTVGVSATDESFIGDSIDVATRVAHRRGEATFTTTKLSATATLKHKIDVRNSLVFGASADRTNFALLNKEYRLGVGFDLVNSDDDALLSQSWLQWKHRLSDNISFITGVHAQHFSLGKATAVEPRASVQYNSDNGHSLSLAYGLNNQTQNLYSYVVQQLDTIGGATTVVYPNESMGFTKAHHLVLGDDWTFAADWRFKAEVYAQWLSNVPISRTNPSFSMLNSGASFAPVNEVGLINEGEGRNVGAEFTLERFFSNGWYMLATASLFESTYKGYDGVQRNTAFNTGYVGNILAGKEIEVGAGVLTISARVTTTGGRYLTPLDSAKSVQFGVPVYREDEAYSLRQTPYFRADLKLGYRLESGRSTMEFSVDLQNVSNHENIFQQTFNRRTGRIVNVYQQGFLPIPTFRYTFSL